MVMQNIAKNDSSEMMTENDKKFFKFLSDLNYRINGFLKIETIIDIIKNAIEGSEVFEFSSRYVRISKSKPVFSLKYNIPDKLGNDTNEKIRYINRKISEEIITVLSNKVNKLLRENKDLKEYMNSASDFGIELPENFDITRYMFSSIFGINHAPNMDMVILEYLK